MTAKNATSRAPLGCWARTASRSARACRGFTTLRRSTWLETFGAVHLSARMGLLSKFCNSAQSSQAGQRPPFGREVHASHECKDALHPLFDLK
jgi:hypothetical protein